MHVEDGNKLDPWSFIVQQLAGPQEFVIEALRKVKSWDDAALDAVASLTKLDLAPLLHDKRRLVIAFDEVEFGLSIDRDFFQRAEGQVRNRGVLAPLTRAASQLQGLVPWQIVFAGTGATVDSPRTLALNVGKGHEANVINAPELFPTCPARDVERLLGRLNLSAEARAQLVDLRTRPLGVAAPDAIGLRDLLEMYVVGGRYRLLCGILESVAQARATSRAAFGSAELLNQAVGECVERHMKGLHDMFKVRLDPKSPPSVYLGDPMLVCLHQIYVAVTIFGGAHFVRREERPSASEINLVALGVAVSGRRTFRDPNAADPQYITEYDVRERFVLDTIRLFFADQEVQNTATAASFKQSVDMLGDVLRRFGPTAQFRGNVVERALLERLAALGASGLYATVADLPFFPSDAPADSWRTVPFRATPVLQTSADHDDVPAFLASPQAMGVVFSPDAQCRPDGVLMLPPGTDGKRRAIVVGSAVYSGSVTKSKDVSQFSSTDLSRAYLSAEGRQYPGAKARREAWCKEGLHRTVAFRIHVSLPTAEGTPLKRQTYARETDVEGSGAPKRMPATSRQMAVASAAGSSVEDEEEDVIVNLDKTNVYKLLGRAGDAPELTALYELLKIATRDEVG